MPFLIPLAVGSAAVSGGAAATAGVIGAGGAVTAGALATTAITVAGTVIGAAAARDQAKTQEEVADANAAALAAKADQTAVVSAEEARLFKERGKRHQARLRVLGAKAGVDPTGTPLLQASSTAGELERERLFIKQGGRQAEFDLRLEEDIQRRRGKAARRAGAFRTGTTLITGGLRLADQIARN